MIPCEPAEGLMRDRESSGWFETGRLAPQYPSITISIPTYNRFVDHLHPELPGPFVATLSGLLAANEREQIGARFLIVDDTMPGADDAITRAVRQASAGLTELPEIEVFGRPERLALYGLLDDLLPQSVDREMVHFVCTAGGYGPQRVRGDLVALGSHFMLSFDDDLRLDGLHQVHSVWLQQRGLAPAEDSFVYVPEACAADPTVVDTRPIPYLRPYLEVLGKSPQDLLRAGISVALARTTINEKDRALQAVLAGAAVAQFRQTYDQTQPLPTTFQAKPVAVASGRVQGVPDINATAFLEYGLHHLQEVGVALSAVVSGPLKPYVIARDTNPTCGLMGRDFTTPVIQLPWLLSNPQIAHTYGRAYGPYRAEDRFYTAPPGDFVMANVATVLTHTRAAQGLRAPNPAGTFWSEAIGDAFGDEARARLQKDPQRGSYLLPKQGARFQIAPERAHALFGQVEDLIALCRKRRKAREQPASEDAIQHLMQMEGVLTEQVSGGFETLYQSLNREIAEQLAFASRFFATYPDLMTACDALVKAGKMPIRRFTARSNHALESGPPRERTKEAPVTG